jgi:hypothetical protein
MRIITTAFVGIAFLVILVVLGTKEFFRQMFAAEVHRKVEEPVSQQLLDLHKMEDEKLNNYIWVNKANGEVRIPVKRAEELVLARYAGAPPPPATAEPTAQPIEPIPMDMMDAPPPAPTEGEGGKGPGAEGEGTEPGGGVVDGGTDKKPEEKKPEEKKPEQKAPAPKPKATAGGDDTYN